jgi:hypothetical protein
MSIMRDQDTWDLGVSVQRSKFEGAAWVAADREQGSDRFKQAPPLSSERAPNLQNRGAVATGIEFLQNPDTTDPRFNLRYHWFAPEDPRA